MVSESSVAGHETAHASFFEKRQLRRYAGIWSLWALGVGAVISGHFSGWNYGLAVAGWGGLLAAAAIMAFMFLCLVFCIAEMSAALPDAGATYVFARRAMGPWGGFLSGVCDNVEYVLTPAVICFFIGSYLGSMFDTGLPDWCWWIATYGLFLVLNIRGIAPPCSKRRRQRLSRRDPELHRTRAPCGLGRRLQPSS
jgi:ethanolamine permease